MELGLSNSLVKRSILSDPILALNLYAGGRQGAYVNPADAASRYQTVGAATTPAAVGDPLGYLLDLSPNAAHFAPFSAAERPLVLPNGMFRLDGIDDRLLGPTAWNPRADWYFCWVTQPLSSVVTSITPGFGLSNGALDYFHFVVEATPRVRAQIRGVNTTPEVAFGNATGSPYAGTGLRVYEAEHQSGLVTFRVNGAAAGTAVSPWTTSVSSGWRLAFAARGANQPTTEPSEFGSALALDYVPDAAARTTIVETFAARHGIAL